MGSNGPVDGAREDSSAEDAPEDDSATDDSATDDGAACACKLGRSSSAYDLAGLDHRLRRRHADGASLRDLEQFVNESILERALIEADADVLGDVGSVYETLVDEEASAGDRTELRRRLSGAGVDVSAVESDFVSYQTVRTHLRDCLDVDTDRDATLSIEDGRGTIEWARSRSEGIVERTLDRLAGSGVLTAGDLDVTHSVRVTCTDCGRSAPIEVFLAGGGCNCPADSTDGSGDVGSVDDDAGSIDDDAGSIDDDADSIDDAGSAADDAGEPDTGSD